MKTNKRKSRDGSVLANLAGKSLLVALAVGLTLGANSAQAAIITWGTVMDTTGPGNVSTTLTSVEAINGGGSSVTVNGVVFIGKNIFGDQEASDATTSGMLDAGDTGDAAFNTLLDEVNYTTDSTTETTIALGYYTQLTPGNLYEVQVFYTDQRAGGHSNRILRVGDGNGNNVDLKGNPNNATTSPWGQFVIGTFTADGPTQDLYVEATNFANVHLNAYQVRLVPEPSTLVLLGLAGLAVMFGYRRRRA